MRFFILNGHKVEAMPNGWTECDWARWYGLEDRHVKDSTYGNFRVSTVFLGIDTRTLSNLPPLVFETMVFDEQDGRSVDVMRCETWEEAELQHESALAEVMRQNQ
jgi:hypothetical protein